MKILICDRCGSKRDVETVIFAPNFVVRVSAMYTVSKPSLNKDLCVVCRDTLSVLCLDFLKGKDITKTQCTHADHLWRGSQSKCPECGEIL